VLEQIVDDYLQFKGYFTTHNVRFKPSQHHPAFEGDQDRVSSDVDVVGLHPQRMDSERVIVVTCKSWQAGFNPRRKLDELRGDATNPKRETWRHFRELWVPKWSEAFRDTVFELTGERTFAYRIAVTRLQGDGDVREWTRTWSEDETIKANLDGVLIRFPNPPGDVGHSAGRTQEDACLERDWSARAASQGGGHDGPDDGGSAGSPHPWIRCGAR